MRHLLSIICSKELHQQEESMRFKIFKCNKCDFSANRKGVLKYHEQLKHKKTILKCELWDSRTSNAQYRKSHMQALCQADYS